MSTQTLSKPPFWCIKCGKRVKKAVVTIPTFDMDPSNTITIEIHCHKQVETREFSPEQYVKFAESGLGQRYHRAFEPKPTQATTH